MDLIGCPFCAIVHGLEGAKILRRWPDAIVITPLDPVTAGHALVIPRRHVPDFAADPGTSALTMVRASEWVRSVPGMQANIITSIGPWATQTVPHLHVHVVPRRPNDNLPLPWTPQQARRRR